MYCVVNCQHAEFLEEKVENETSTYTLQKDKIKFSRKKLFETVVN
jgi:hypothetical protein